MYGLVNKAIREMVYQQATERYSQMGEMARGNLPEFLHNLDNLHARVGLSFAQLKPPLFECSDVQQEYLNLQCHYTIKWLALRGIGFWEGVGKRFNTNIDTTHTRSRGQRAKHEELSIHFQEYGRDDGYFSV